MKKIIGIWLLMSVVPAWAQTPQDAELLSAQVAYQQALNYYQGQTVNLSQLKSQVEVARQRYESAKMAYEKAQQDLAQAQAKQQQANDTLQAAGQRLNRAWETVRGSVPK